MTKYLVTIEFRYEDAPKHEEGSEYRSDKITIGVYDDFDEACKNGNSLLENLESKFDLHVFPSGVKAAKERFSKNGGCFGSKNTLVTNLAYLKTPFQFFAKITALNHASVDETVSDVVDAVKRFRTYRKAVETD